MYEYFVAVESKCSGKFVTPMDTEERAVAFAALCLKNETAELKAGQTVIVSITKSEL